jgi:hypothetical protein
MLTSKVIHSHTPETKDFLACSAGDVVAFERRETIYPGWIWCTDEYGKQAWVPEAYVNISGEKCQFVRDYNSRELVVHPGEKVRIIEVVSKWARVVNERGKKGWVPFECLLPPEHTDNP